MSSSAELKFGLAVPVMALEYRDMAGLSGFGQRGRQSPRNAIYRRKWQQHC
jgi:hypothetical protein